ncbi:uncharacterized protein LOC110989967 [Acanthaster planci]|uniref:Uncharacterized protein LOC110989967 n=1 Tax=Acanthaster planci TaxID=133434 RepID=A0A8B7ZXV9_ACAPL|nr:uncharacterized protein LOC110989967 [Acanthaster planci]
MGVKSVLLVLLVVLGLACRSSARRCSYSCSWPDTHSTLCDSRFVNIFYGTVRAAHKESDKGFVDYAVEVTTVYRSENSRFVHEGAVVTLHTILHEYICPVQKMRPGFTAYFAVGPLGDFSSNYRIQAGSCDSYISVSLPTNVKDDLSAGKFNRPC